MHRRPKCPFLLTMFSAQWQKLCCIPVIWNIIFDEILWNTRHVCTSCHNDGQLGSLQEREIVLCHFDFYMKKKKRNYDRAVVRKKKSAVKQRWFASAVSTSKKQGPGISSDMSMYSPNILTDLSSPLFPLCWKIPHQNSAVWQMGESRRFMKWFTWPFLILDWSVFLFSILLLL